MNPEPQSWRRSRLEASPGDDADPVTLVFGDLHNHSLHSDGRGDPEQAFEQMRAAGLDVAALTDHASIPHADLDALGLHHYPDPEAVEVGRSAPRSFDAAAWERTGELADKHDVPGEFTALRGFEWTEPWLGHVNVWFSDTYLPVTTPGALQGLEDWLNRDEPEALYGYNHPGREPGRLAGFAVPDDPQDAGPALAGRMVAVEVFNRTLDFLFGGYDRGDRSPIVDCLDEGWRPGLIGCSDEHGRSYGLAGKGRTGLWVREHSREGVREALLARRTFATREVGLRLDATLDGVRMGSAMPAGRRPADGRHELAVDLAGSAYEGRPVELQVLSSGGPDADGGREVAVLARIPARVGEVARARVELPPGVRWVLVRVADPRRPYGEVAPPGHPAACWALAYTSPWYLDT